MANASDGHCVDAQFLEVFEAGGEVCAVCLRADRQINVVIRCKAQAFVQHDAGLLLSQGHCITADHVDGAEAEVVANGCEVVCEVDVAQQGVQFSAAREAEFNVVDT